MIVVLFSVMVSLPKVYIKPVIRLSLINNINELGY